MNGVAVVVQLLLDSDDISVPDARILSGVLPLSYELPSVTVTSVSAGNANMLRKGATRHVNERVQVTVYAQTYRQAKQIIAQVRTTCAHQFPTVAGVSDVVVLTDGQGPDMMVEEPSVHIQTQDFSVSYNEPA